jgi:Protein of unknown function (DUF998)
MKENKRFIRWSYTALIACVFATVCDVVSLAVFARFYPGYDPGLQPISALGASGSPIARFVSGWWILLGFVFLLFAFAYGKSNVLHNPAQKIAAWLIGVYGLGEEAGSGLFPGNHVAGHLTSTGIIHNGIGGIGTVALIAVPFVLMIKYNRTDHPAFHRFLLIISLTGILFFLIFSLSRLTLPAMQGLRLLHGLWQRLFVADYYIMLVVIAARQVLEAKRPSDFRC